MVKGIGIDIVNIDRIERLVERYKSVFLNKVFTNSEIEWCSQKARPSMHYAGRWAAKEAFYKALSSQCQKKSMWKSIEVLADASRKPYIHVRDDELKQLLSNEAITQIYISISHEMAVCTAMVVLE
jgi:holo-[acyl-carrier protein] synthase